MKTLMNKLIPGTNKRRKSKSRGRKLSFETLAERTLMSASLGADGILRVEGTDQPEAIRIVNDAGQISVEGDFITLPDGRTVNSVPVADIVYARVDGRGGNDRIEMFQKGVSAATALILEADGGIGNDTIVGGSAADRLFGGVDVDQLIGGAGVDQLDGGGQQDAVFQATAIDASALLPMYLTVDHVYQDPKAPFGMDLAPGNHFIYTHGSAVAWFNVGDDGTIGYDSALEGILSGQGTSALKVHGVEVTINATALSKVYMTLDYVPIDSGTPLTTRLLPGDHFIYTHGAAVVWFKVANDGTISYDPALEGAFSGQGTNSLTVNGVEVHFDASALLSTYLNLDYVVQDTDRVFSARLLPGDHFVYTHGQAVAWFKVANNGTISYDPSLELALSGHGTNSLKVDGVEVRIDATSLWNKYMTVDYVARDPNTPHTVRLLPGDHFVYTIGSAVAWFKVGTDGTVRYDSALEGVLAGQGTNSLKVNGRAVSVNPAAMSETILTLDNVSLSSQQPFQARLLPGVHWVLTASGKYHYFTLGNDGITDFDPALAGVLSSIGPTLGADGVLRIRGTNNAETIRVVQNGIVLSIDGLAIAYTHPDGSVSSQSSVPTTLVGRIEVEALGGSDTVTFDTSAGTGRIVPIQILGGAGNDTLTGGAGQNTLVGGDGSDMMYGGDAADSMMGASLGWFSEVGSGNDTMYGFGGNDTMHGGDGDDRLYGGNDNDRMIGNNGNDYLEGNKGRDTLYGCQFENALEVGNADDTIYGGTGNDLLVGGDGADLMIGQHGNDLFWGNGGNDVLWGGERDDSSLYQLSDRDTMYSGEGADLLYGGGDADEFHGGIGDDTLRGNHGADTMFGDEDADDIWGGSHNDVLGGNDGNDELYGENGNDSLDGGTGRDTLEGGSQDDTLIGGEGLDFLHGGLNNDVLFGAGWENNYTYWDAGNFLWGNEGNDNLYGGNSSDHMEGGTGDDGLFGGNGWNTLIGGEDDDRFLTWAGAVDTISDQDARDATIRFADTPAMNNVPPPNGWDRSLPYNYLAGNWTANEIYHVDRAFDSLHDHTSNTRLLAMPNDREYTFFRRGQQTSGVGGFGGQNDFNGNITIGQSKSATLDIDTTLQTVYHEIGHSWGDQSVNNHYKDFLGISGWVKNPTDTKGLTQGTDTDSIKDGNQNPWWYRHTNLFAKDYARGNPGDDWATTWETYFMDKFHGTLLGNTKVQAKYDNLDLLFGDLRN